MTTSFNSIPKLYSINQVANIFGVSKITIYRLVESKMITIYKIKGCIRFSENDILEYLEKQRIKTVG